MSSPTLEKLFPGCFYHVYNKSITGEKLFRNESDYYYFLLKLERFVMPVANIHCYCLIPNHFHLLVEIKNELELSRLMKMKRTEPHKFISQTFGNFFNSYAKSYNLFYNRLGRLFLYPFRRKLVEDDDYLKELVVYIHRNPVRHELVSELMEWKYTSIHDYLNTKKGIIQTTYVLSLFGSLSAFKLDHDLSG
jgi:REP element-mobilizing transposase RayT